MSGAERLYGAIDSIDDKYVAEAFRYKKKKPIIRVMAAVAACLCICVAIQSLHSAWFAAPVTVYAYGTGREIGWTEPTLMDGTITDDGEMHGAPLQFYISGKSIDTIRFSVKNQYISFTDWTEKRKDYGYSKSFMIQYGDEAYYYYLVINWEPMNLIRTLTDNTEIGIANLTEDEREDIIVMEITYETGKEETCAININLTDEGKFEAEVVPYEISESDTFVLNPDTEAVPAYQDSSESAAEESNRMDVENESSHVSLSEADLKRITEFVEEYYVSLSYEATSITPDYEETRRQSSDYDGYSADEIFVFKVSIKDDEIPRYITIGSKDGWQECTVLNEGY